MEGCRCKTYGTEVIRFSDRPAAALANVALRKIATIYKEINEEAAEKIKMDSYVDDIITGVHYLKYVEAMMADLEDILEKGGFKLKGFVMFVCESGEPLILLASGDLGRVLGMGWDPRQDMFKIKVRINLSKEKGGKHVGDVPYEDITSIVNIVNMNHFDSHPQ